MGLSLAHINIRSLSRHFADLKDIIVQENFDIIGLTETWLSDNDFEDELHIEGYKFIRRDRDTRGGGVGVYLKSGLDWELLNFHSLNSLEQLWVRISVRSKKIIIGILYRPPNSSIIDFIGAFENSLSEVTVACDEVICCGDTNINFLDLNNRKTSLFMDCIDSFNLKQVINSPTRVTGTSSTLIDIILISNGLDCNCGTQALPHISDHYLIYCTLSIPKLKSEPYYQEIRNLKFIDTNHLNELLSITPFENIFNIEDINDKVDYFNNLMITLYDTIAPLKKIKIKRRNPPWLTANVKFMIKLRNNALCRFNNTNNVNHWEYYKSLRNQTNIVIRNEKKQFIERFQVNNNSKLLWKKLGELNIYSKSKINHLPEKLNQPNDINDFFLRHSLVIGEYDRELLNFYNNNQKLNFESKFSFTQVTEIVVYKFLLEIKSKSSGVDLLNIDMLLLCCPFILPYLTDIMNTCLRLNIFPTVWKTARVLPLPKKSNPNEFNDLRPISILPVLSKVLEKIMHFQSLAHLTKYQILPNYQSGFRSKHSCATALLTIVDDILKSTDDGKTTALILLDYSKAFDTISHNILISILNFIGFSDDAQELIISYLSNRQQYVQTSSGKSYLRSVNCGVPQGSILGPLLFCIYTCNITACLKYCTPHLYADDTQIYFSFFPNDYKNASTAINKDLSLLVTASDKHNLKLNHTKSSLLIFGKNKQLVAENIDIRINDNKLKCTAAVKNLGVEMDTDLRFKEHVNKCIQKAYLNLKLLFPHRHILTQKLKIQLTDSLVLSHFNYCDTVYGPCLDNIDINRIEKVQKSCLRFAFGIRKYCRISYKLKAAKWLCMTLRRDLHCMSLYHNILTYKSPQYLYNKIKYRSDVHNLGLRFRKLISPPPHKTAMYRRSFSFSIYYHYNKIPTNFKLLNPSSFKIKYKQYLMLK